MPVTVVNKNANSNFENKLAKATAEVAANSNSNNNNGQKEKSQEKESSQQPTGNKTPPEQPEFIKQALIIIEKKVRNLDKRRVSYRIEY